MSVVHAMADFETLGVRPTSAVLSLGVVAFTTEGVLDDTFYVNIDADDCISLGLTTDQSTIDWWAKQSQAAKDALDADKKPLLIAMSEFCSWMRRTKCETLWGNGADFDNPILRNIFSVIDADFPFKPWAGRCYRTIKNIPGAPKMPKRVGTHHNALDDAMSQALHLIEINKQIRVFE